MKQIITLLLLFSLSILCAVGLEQYQATGNGLSAKLQQIQEQPMVLQPANIDEGDTSAQTATIMKTYAFPYRNANLRINSMKWNVFDRNNNFLYVEDYRDTESMEVARSFQFREMSGVTVKINTQRESQDYIKTLLEVDFELEGSNPITLPQTVSPAFIDAYKELADNYDTSYLRNLPVSRPSMLIISHPQLANYQGAFINWKKSLGFDVYVVNKADAGNSLQEIKAYIANFYQQHHCDYLMLWGDVNGNMAIPTNFYPSPEYAGNDADDHYYTLIEGDDYFPEMLVGRFSISDVSQFITISNKTIYYEKTPFMTNTDWMNRNLVVAGNYAEGGLRPSTPVSMSRWLRNKMLDYGYTQVDTVFYPPSNPGTQNIISSINQGVQFISYRGWGDANGWHYPYFHTSDLNNTITSPRTPIVFSIVCNTGDFANSVNPSFGERWMQMGSMAIPGGAVAFVGPSDLHTKTRLNNSISTGAFRSILDKGVRGFGSSVLIGKLELYKNFPNDIDEGEYVPFYYHVYNILSDPSLNMWVRVPQTIPESVIEGGLTYQQSDSHIRINASNLNGAIVSGTKNGIDFTYTTLQHGYAILPINPNETGNLTITISKPNFVPLVKELSPTGTSTIGLVSNSLAEALINPATNNSITLGFKNFSTSSYNNLGVSLSCNKPGVVISNPSQTVASLNAGATSELSFNFTVAATLTPGEIVDFTVTFTNPAEQQMFQLKTGGATFSILSHSGLVTPGQTSNIQYTITNTGNVAMTDVSIRAFSNTTAASVQANPISIGTVNPGQSTQFTANITVPSNVWEGRNLPLRFEASNSTGYTSNCFYAVTVGTPGTNDPTGPDEYGYFAYDSTDEGHAQRPTYNWVEIDPRDGGQGQVYLIQDDGSKTVSLPFNFRFYGVDYNSITMCSNGWISFIPSDMTDFYNCYIPAALGPYTMVAGYWDDLKGRKVETSPGVFSYNDMRVCYWYDAANNRYIVQWNDAYNQYTIDDLVNPSLEKFQIILYPRAGADGDIVVQYHTIDNPGTTTNYCTVGIEDHTQMRGLTYTHGNTYPVTASTLTAGLAVKFTTVAPDTYVLSEDPVAAVPVTNLRNYPNPFNPSTTISFNAMHAGKAKLSIFNLKGQLVKTLLDTDILSGEQKIVWDGTDSADKLVGSGIYFYQLEMGSYNSLNKMLMMK